MKKPSDWIGPIATALALASLSPPAEAQQVIRRQIDVEGDFKLIGNTLAYECSTLPGNPNIPVVGTVGAGACTQANISDQGPDLFWRSDSPADGQATADQSITAAEARSTAHLTIDPSQSVIYARLYWAARSPTGTPDDSVVLDRPGPGGFSEVVTADVQHVPAASAPAPTLGTYESSADVTDIVLAHGSGAYRIGDVASVDLVDANVGAAFAAWSLVVFYEEAGQPLRQLTLFDGLSTDQSTINISGFLVPQDPTNAKFGIVAYNGDGQTGGDALSFNGVDVVDFAGNNDFFNGSRAFLGAAVSNAGDLPQLTGLEGSHPGLDIDVVDVSAQVGAGDTTASIVAKPGGDGNILVGAVVTSIPTFKPNYNDSTKTAQDLNGGSLLPGDVLRYTLDIINTGNDPALGVVVEDPLPTGVTFVPGSIEVLTGPNTGTKTDVTGDDEGEYLSGTQTVRVRLGTGADGTTGGRMDIGESILVQFDVTVDGAPLGTISNQATITAAGEQGAPETDFTSTDPVTPGPTDVIVDECLVDADCPVGRPYCLQVATPADAPNVCVECLDNPHCGGAVPVCDGSNQCVPCTTDADCDVDPNAPACQPGGACGECSATNATLCTGTRPICLTGAGTCGCTDVDGDSECGGPNSGRVCSGPAGTCIAGCYFDVAGRNDCPLASFCSASDGTLGTCSPQACVDSGDCTDPTPVCFVPGAPDPNECVACLIDGDCTGTDVCDEPNHSCVECTDTKLDNCSASQAGAICLVDNTCGCAVDADCGAVTSGRVCDVGGTDRCALGCRGTAGNGCPTTLVCTSTDASVGECVDCVTDADCGGATPRCDVGTNTCVGCLDNTDCSGATPACSGGVCVPCSSDANCTNDPARPACQTSGTLAGRCTECSATNLSQCSPTDEPSCLPSGQCGCTDTDGDSECGAADSGRICNGPAGVCVDGCSLSPSRNDCPATQYCTEQTGAIGECLPHCTSNAECTTAPNTVCDTTPIPHECVECLADTDCNAPMVCDRATRTCVGCTSDADCATAPNETCDLTTQRCVDCLDNAGCTAPDVCDTTAQTCVGCLSDADCTTAPNETCDRAAQTCVDCLDDSGCTAPEVCDTTARVCVGCVDSSDCTAPEVCDTTAQQCVDCLSDADCTTAPNETCDRAAQTCVDCLDDSGCTAPDVCDTTARVCVGCVDDADCSDATRCDGTVQRCVGCLSDADCNAPDVCDRATQTCVGCVDDADCTTAPNETCDTTAQECVDCLDDSGCTAPEVCDANRQVCVGCSDDADCTAPEVCNTTTQTCVGCVDDADCTAPDVCDTDSETCVECTPDRTDACTAEGAGAACLPDTNTCGCESDSDCGDATSGRICEPDAGACGEGCRGTDGNGCGEGETCTSETSDPGECVPTEEPFGLSNAVEGGGCACTTPAGQSEPGPWGLFALAAVGLTVARRRRAA